jgi:uroporphyrinogen-III synthase
VKIWSMNPLTKITNKRDDKKKFDIAFMHSSSSIIEFTSNKAERYLDSLCHSLFLDSLSLFGLI